MGNGESPPERPNSVEVSVTTKGEISFKVKVYADDPEAAMRTAQARAEEMMVWREIKVAGAGPKKA